VGEAVIRDRIRWARERGLRQLILLTTTAGSYFPRLGFRPIARREVPESVRGSSEFAAVCPASAAVLSLDLEEA
jgi:amino-acid N-acetyltransferase